MTRVLIFLFFMQFLSCGVLAQEEPSVPVESDEYDVADTIKKGKQIILDQKEQLEAKEKTEEEIEEAIEEEVVEARREIYEQMAIQEVEVSRPTLTIESEIRAEQYRRQIMTTAGQEPRPSFKKRQFNIRAKETYDDNVFLTKGSGRKKDYITKISPSAVFSLGSKYIRMDSNYVMDITRYRYQEKQSGVSHLLFTAIRPGIVPLPFSKGRGGKIGFEIQNTFQPAITSIASSEETSRTERLTNRLLIMLDYYMSKKKTLALEYRNNYTHYKLGPDKLNNFTEHIISPKFYFHVTPKWSLLTGYDYGRKAYPKGLNDSVYHRLKTGATGKFFKKMVANFEIGEEWKDYEEAASGEAQEIFFKGAFLNRFSPSTRASLRYEHSITDSNTTDNPYYISDAVNFDFEHNFSFKTKGLFGIRYIRNAYTRDSTVDETTKTRQDSIYGSSIELRYYFKKQAYANLEYAFSEKISNFGDYNYVDNRITAGINAQF